MTPDILLHLLARFLHVGSVIVLLGGLFYARQVLVPTLSRLPEEARTSALVFSQKQFASTLWILLALIVVSGFYNFYSYTGPKHSSSYQMWFGIKMLLVLHVVATSILWATSAKVDRNSRRLLSLTISGFVIVLISAYLRSLSQRGL